METGTSERAEETPLAPRRRAVHADVHLALSRGWVAALVAVWLVPWTILVVVLAWRGNAPEAPQRQSGTQHGERVRGQSGPWGSLEYLPMVISPPVEFIQQLDPQSIGNPWHFPTMDQAQLTAFLAEADLSDSVREQLLALARPEDAPETGTVIKPTAEIIRGLSPSARAHIYHHLGLFSVNLDQMNAMRFCGKTPQDWFDGSNLSPQTLDLIKPLIYRNGSFIFFADFALVLPALSDDHERERLMKALSSSATLRARLHVDRDTDIETLIRYWGRGGRETDVRPTIESLTRATSDGVTGIRPLLPQFAQNRLYIFSPPSLDQMSLSRDCHWNALNFFNKEADDRFADPAAVAREVDTNYDPIFGNVMFGDLVMFVRGKDKLVHTAVYIADNVLFTKNGTRSTEPSMLIRLDDMKDYYPSPEPLRISYRRRKGL